MPGASDEEISEALRLAAAEDFVSRLPEAWRRFWVTAACACPGREQRLAWPGPCYASRPC